MQIKDLYDLVRKGYKPVIQFTDNFTNYMDDSADPMMRGKIIKAYYEENDDSCTFEIDLNDFEEYNKSVAIPIWQDINKICRLTWFESQWYPKNGIETMWFPLEVEVEEVFTIIDDNKLIEEYRQTKTELPYVEWLENLVLELRNK